MTNEPLIPDTPILELQIIVFWVTTGAKWEPKACPPVAIVLPPITPVVPIAPLEIIAEGGVYDEA